MAAPAIVRALRVSATGTNGSTSLVGEPSAAVLGDAVLSTGNWFAAQSDDGGASWAFIDPASYLTPQPATPFCCDQTVIHVPSHEIVVWLLQYEYEPAGNTLRVAVNRGATLDLADWIWWDLTPTTLDPSLTDEWFDFNHAALSDNFLYIGTNMYKTFGTPGKEPWARSVVMRLPLDTLAGGGPLRIDYIESTTLGPIRCTAGATTTMYAVVQNDLQSLHVWTWPETGAISEADVQVTPWAIGAYVSKCPDGTEWLSRCDDRITAAWVANGRIGIAWSSNAMPPARPHPFVRVVLLDEATLSLDAEPDIWNRRYALAYPDACPNENGRVAVTLFRGGGGVRNPGHVIGLLEEVTTKWSLRNTVDGTNGPVDGTWGDYIHCRRSSPDGSRWIATGYTLQGGSEAANVEHHIVEFRV